MKQIKEALEDLKKDFKHITEIRYYDDKVFLSSKDNCVIITDDSIRKHARSFHTSKLLHNIMLINFDYKKIIASILIENFKINPYINPEIKLTTVEALDYLIFNILTENEVNETTYPNLKGCEEKYKEVIQYNKEFHIEEDVNKAAEKLREGMDKYIELFESLK